MLSSLAFATVETLQIVFIHHKRGATDGLCTAIGWLVVYTQSTKLFFTMWITVHLFCFAVFYRNLKKLEALYVVTSLLLPAGIASVPLATHSYVLSSSGRCYIYTLNETHDTHGTIVLVEKFVLWDGPAFVILLAASVVMVAVVAKLAKRVCKRVGTSYEPVTDGDQYWNALKQILPLAAFPLLFLVFIIPLLVIDLDIATEAAEPSESGEKARDVSNWVFISLWSAASGATLIVHVSVARCAAKRRTRLNVGLRYYGTN